ncbi:hypothetical protein PsorP6_007553 [Peronosclerospora sorghi]|uniref:Uncharacterized protein n=1 Tax=Peronosclerospora sorghi TaxID=230839 RepID=A0ACC0W821_9STRA|nr:hypothetical protein PsorP6_007553 [Peronosclerospora sorghi]
MEKKTPLKQERLEHDEETARRVALDIRRQSKRSANKNSDGDVYKEKKKLQKRDEGDSDDAEFQLDTSQLKTNGTKGQDEVAAAPTMVIDKIMGVR